MTKDALRLLVKAHPSAMRGTLALGARRTRLELEPLFKSIERPRKTALSINSKPVWHIASAPRDDLNPWEACYALMEHGLGFAGAAGVSFAEPDLEQRWDWTDRRRAGLAAAEECGAPKQQDGDIYAVGPTDFWFRDEPYSQLAAAQALVPKATLANRVRIAHLDTGYDPGHSSRPELLRADLARNFVDSDRPNDATDERTGLLNLTYGHGTATIALLAGKDFGGAPHLEVVPIRVANFVVLFRNSAIAQALDHIHGLWPDPATRIHVASMSMGGIASGAWADAVNALYEQGVFVATAAGNNKGNLPSRYIVYPARFRRVVAACGVMADGRPYADLPFRKMAGCYGPESKERTALAAFTPNLPWAKIGCPALVDWDGGGTSSATPQIAAAAALWIQKNKARWDAYSQGWMRVEAVRRALFDSAENGDATHFGHGIIRAEDALAERPSAESELVKEDEDSASFSLLRTITGLGVEAPLSARQRMIELEALQLSQVSKEIEDLLAGRDANDRGIASALRRAILEALGADPRASSMLKLAVAAALRDPAVPAPPRKDLRSPRPKRDASQRISEPIATAGPSAQPTAARSDALDPITPPPAARKLRVYAFDPSLATNLDTVNVNEATVAVYWEDLKPGPVGEYLEVVDIDPARASAYAAVDLNAVPILAQHGLAPTEGNPQFHQQMVYAVAMKTIAHFERALGRVALWAPRFAPIDGKWNSRFVRRLRIYPHAFYEDNAIYSPDKLALLFGYFNAPEQDENLPGGLIFTCLSHDIVAHETTHALLDGLHRRFKEPTNPDMLAFHEAFADIVALFQHFTLPQALREELSKSRGAPESSALLGYLAHQFGQATGHRRALRSAVGTPPQRTDYDRSKNQHALGAVLVSAVFDAFIQIYRRRTEDLFRLATGGTGVLPPGAIPHDLADRLAEEAAKIAGHVLNICIRALDYCPPVDLTFGEYLRALITADREMVPVDDLDYRVAFIAAFRARGIFPEGVTNLSVEALGWQRPELPLDGFEAALNKVIAGDWKSFTRNWRLGTDRHQAFLSSKRNAEILHRELIHGKHNAGDDEFRALGLVRTAHPCVATIDGVEGKVSRIELHSVRPARRVAPDGEIHTDVVIEITQKWMPNDGGSFRSGATIICEPDTGRARYVVRKRIGNARRVGSQREFSRAFAAHSIYGNYFSDRNQAEPFGLLHRGM